MVSLEKSAEDQMVLQLCLQPDIRFVVRLPTQVAMAAKLMASDSVRWLDYLTIQVSTAVAATQRL